MPKQIIGKVVSPPNGWKFANNFLIPVTEYSEATFGSLYTWAKEKKYGLEPHLDDYWSYSTDGVYLYCRFRVWKDSWEITEKWLGDGTWTVHEKKYSLGQTMVSSKGVHYWNQCAHCLRGGLNTQQVGPAKNRKRLCPVCAFPCATEGCPEWLSVTGKRSEPVDKCFICVPRSPCHFCKVWHPEESLESFSHGEAFACETCAKDRKCSDCRLIRSDVKGGKQCRDCHEKQIEKERVKHEKFLVSELPQGGKLSLETLPNRPVRVISVETEVDGDPNIIAQTLFNCGLVRERIVESYGSKCPDTSHWAAFLKYDGSVKGGELITYLLQLDKPKHAEAFLTVLSKMRSLEKLGKVAYNANCGGHIHIDAHNFSTDNLWRLVTGYNYLEDVIFRLAGSGHAYGHRTLVPGHDAANHGRGYSHPTAKGPWGVKSGAHQALAGQDRMTGLNFQPYFHSVRYCDCGAGAENLRSCKCTLPKCTIEWRVWNSQGNPRILHGWLAFMQALHAWADSPKEMTDAEEREYPILGWTKKAWHNTSSGHQKLALERIKWIFSNLVFTPAERDSLVFAFKQTDITFPGNFWQEIAAIPTPKNRNVKAPRNCVIRKKEIVISPPKAGAKLRKKLTNAEWAIQNIAHARPGRFR